MMWAFLIGIFIITFIVIIELIWLGYRIVIRKEKGLSLFESKLAISAGLFIVIVIAIILVGHKTSISWIYRNPIFYLPFRFAIVYLIGIPIFLAARSSAQMQNKTAWKKVILYGLIISIVLTIGLIKYPSFGSAILIIYPLVFQAMFGILPALYHNPIQMLIPFAIAIGVHLYFYNTRYLQSFKPKDIFYTIPLYIVVISFFLIIFTAPIIFLPPTNYDWFRDYLNQKYGVAIQYGNLTQFPQPLHIVNDIKPPTGLVCKYLVFGEKAVDYSAMTD
jgi:hypothetical protein